MNEEAFPQPGGRRLLSRAVLVAGALMAASLAWDAAPASAVLPDAEFGFAPAAPVAGQQVRFDASATTEAGGGIPPPENYDWDFDGDNDFNDAQGIVVTRAFDAAGSYEVLLRVTGSDGVSQDTENATVAVAANRLPVASFFATPPRPAVNEVVRFTSRSFDANGPLRGQAWDLDADGAFDDGSGTVASRRYTSPGTRLVRLRVVDNSGAVSIGNLVMSVAEPTVVQFPLISPFPVVRLAGRLSRRGARIRILSVKAPAGSRVVVRCRGRLCPRRRAVTRTRRSDRPVRIRRFERRLQAGVVLEVFVSRPGMIGKHTRFLIRRGKPPRRRDGCLLPGSTRRSSCPRR